MQRVWKYICAVSFWFCVWEPACILGPNCKGSDEDYNEGERWLSSFRIRIENKLPMVLKEDFALCFLMLLNTCGWFFFSSPVTSMWALKCMLWSKAYPLCLMNFHSRGCLHLLPLSILHSPKGGWFESQKYNYRIHNKWVHNEL